MIQIFCCFGGILKTVFMASALVLQYMSSPQKANIFDRKPLLYKHNPRETLLNNLREKCRKRIQDSREVYFILTKKNS